MKDEIKIQDNKQKYYYFKMPFDFFDRPTTRAILAMTNGAAIIVLFQNMIKASADRDGYLRLTDSEPYTPETLTLLGFSLEVCKDAFIALKRYGLINILDDGTIDIVDFENFVGSESKWAQYKREQRKTKSAKCRPNVGQNADNVATMSGQCSSKIGQKLDTIGQCPTKLDNVQQMSKHIEIEREKEKETEIELEKRERVSARPTLEEIKEYISKNKKSVSPEVFFNYYEVRSWKGSRGEDLSKSWKNMVDLWEARDKAESKRGNLAKVTEPAPAGYQRDNYGVLYMTNNYSKEHYQIKTAESLADLDALLDNE